MSLILSRQEDFDVTRGTILDSRLGLQHFDQIKASIFIQLKQRERRADSLFFTMAITDLQL